MTWGVFVVAALAAYRVARIVTTDDITARARLALVRRYPASIEPMTNPDNGQPIEGSSHGRPHTLVVFVHCTWCVSVWTSLAAALVAHATGLCNSWTLVGFDWLAAATLCGFLARLEA